MRSFLGRGAGAYGAERELSSLEMSRGLPDYAGGSRKARINNNERDLFLENPVWEKLTARADHLYQWFRHRARQKATVAEKRNVPRRRPRRTAKLPGHSRSAPRPDVRVARHDASRPRRRHRRSTASRARHARRPDALAWAWSAYDGDAVNGQNGTYVDVTPTVTEQVADRFGTQPSHRSGHTMVRAPPRDPKRPQPPRPSAPIPPRHHDNESFFGASASTITTRSLLSLSPPNSSSHPPPTPQTRVDATPPSCSAV